MARKLNDGLVMFSRKRLKLRPPKSNYTRHKIRGCSLHHGGPVGAPRMTFAEAADTVRSWQNFHMDARGWNDIGYNLLVDGLGRLYEGRPVDTVPAAVENFNTGFVGINFMQDGRRWGLTKEQRNTLKILFEKGIPKLGLPPLKDLDTRVHNEFPGHTTNECPGNKIKRHVRWRRSQYK